MVKSDAAARWSLKASEHAQSQGKTTESTVRTNTFSSTIKEQKTSEFKCNFMQSDITKHVLIITNSALTTQYIYASQ